MRLDDQPPHPAFWPTGTVYGSLLNFQGEVDAMVSVLIGPQVPVTHQLSATQIIATTLLADVAEFMTLREGDLLMLGCGCPHCNPVACLISFTDETDAVAKANDIQYGLSSDVWTENLGRAHRVAAAVEASMCFVNSQNVRDLRQPFGGTKANGTGREGGTWSYEVFCEPKNVAVSLGSHHIPHWGL